MYYQVFCEVSCGNHQRIGVSLPENVPGGAGRFSDLVKVERRTVSCCFIGRWRELGMRCAYSLVSAIADVGGSRDLGYLSLEIGNFYPVFDGSCIRVQRR